MLQQPRQPRALRKGKPLQKKPRVKRPPRPQKLVSKKVPQVQPTGPSKKEELKKDARSVTAIKEVKLVNNALNTISIQQLCANQAILGICVNYISQAVLKGFLTLTQSPSDAFGAFYYMYGILNAYVRGGVPQAIQLPYWLVQLGQSLAAKTQVKFGLGNFSYSIQQTDDLFTVPNTPLIMGPSAYGNKWSLNVAGSGKVNNLPISINPDIPSDGGEAAWNALQTFMPNPKEPWTTLVNIGTATPGKSSTSAFAIPTCTAGEGFSDTGGWMYIAQMEVPIREPILSTLCAADIQSNAIGIIRTGIRSTSAGGDSLWTGSFCSKFPGRMWAGKKYPRFHCIDFMEFASVIALWVSTLQTTYCASPKAIEAIGLQTLDPTSIICPISLQELLLCLRNEMCLAFQKTQDGVQGMSPIYPNLVNSNYFEPYVISTTTAPKGSCNITFPESFVENIKCLVGRYIKHPKTKDIEFWVPVLGDRHGFTLTQSDYSYTININGTVTTYPSFTTPAIHKKVRSKTGDSWVPQVETPINFPDGAAAGQFLFINDQEALQLQATMWNNWTKPLAAFCDPLVQVGTDTGPSILCSVSMTRHCSIVPSSEIAYHEEYKDPRLAKYKGMLASPYTNLQVNADSSNGPIFAPTYDGIQSTWILPFNDLVTLSGYFETSTQLQRYQSMMNEPFSVVRSATGITSIPISQLHQNYAQKMVFAEQTQKNDWLEFFRQASQEGSGGVLSGLLAQFAGQGLNALAGALPF